MKKLFIIAVLALFVLPTFAFGQDIRSAWIADSNPGDTVLGDPPWGAENETGHAVAGGADVWIGINNDFRWVNMKALTVTLTGTGVENLEVVEVRGAMKGGMIPSGLVDSTFPGAGTLTLYISIFPQPAWETIMLTNTGGAATIASIEAESVCTLVPTTTTYGLAILALLLIGSTVWILRRRHAGAAA